jgi:2-polyprenyl-3-methyl-5-hydroxy-6-metoxy-1,4-benzoquinol methylase
MAKYETIMSWLPKKNNLRVLNAGCGSGEMNVLLSKNNTWQIDAIDVDEEAIKLSESLKSKFKISNINIKKIEIENLISMAKYDIIVCNDVLEHIEDDRAAIKKLNELLKTDGILCISVPALNLLFGYHDEMLGHYRRYNKKNLKEKLAGLFEVKKCRYFGFSLIPAALIYSRVLRKPYPLAGLSKDSFKSKILNGILKTESTLGAPIGISLLVLAAKK